MSDTPPNDGNGVPEQAEDVKEQPTSEAPGPVASEEASPSQESTSLERPPQESPPKETFQQEKPRRNGGRRWAIALLVIVTLVVAAFVTVQFVLSAPSATPRATEFEVLPGWGGARVAAELEEAGLVRSAPAFRYYLQFTETDRNLGEGLYDLSPTMSASEVAAALAAGGRPRTVSIVVPEGWRASDVVRRLAANGIATEDELETIVSHPADLAPAYLPDGANLEGYLFPATYDVPVHSSPEDVVSSMLERFQDELTGDVVDALIERSLTVHEWVTLASIVQSEAASHEEMPIIAGVFLNRLDDGMLLQSDPTVAYGLGKPMPELSALAGDLRQDTPWNTYMRPGLPATPISNPGSHALHAVLEPVRLNDAGVPWLYFLHGTDGGIPVFRPNTNLAAHERDVVVFLRNDGRR